MTFIFSVWFQLHFFYFRLSIENETGLTDKLENYMYWNESCVTYGECVKNNKKENSEA